MPLLSLLNLPLIFCFILCTPLDTCSPIRCICCVVCFAFLVAISFTVSISDCFDFGTFSGDGGIKFDFPVCFPPSLLPLVNNEVVSSIFCFCDACLLSYLFNAFLDATPPATLAITFATGPPPNAVFTLEPTPPPRLALANARAVIVSFTEFKPASKEPSSIAVPAPNKAASVAKVVAPTAAPPKKAPPISATRPKGIFIPKPSVSLYFGFVILGFFIFGFLSFGSISSATSNIFLFFNSSNFFFFSIILLLSSSFCTIGCTSSAFILIGGSFILIGGSLIVIGSTFSLTLMFCGLTLLTSAFEIGCVG